jgi:hypothetical protein
VIDVAWRFARLLLAAPSYWSARQRAPLLPWITPRDAHR